MTKVSKPMTLLNPNNPLVTDVEIAKALGMSVDWVRKDRMTKRLLPYFKTPSGSVRYSLEQVSEAMLQWQIGGYKLNPR
jgi:hypothetical protein